MNNKRSIFGKMAIVAMVAMVMASCNNESPKMDEEPEVVDTANEGGAKIAYVELDSLMSQYNFCKDFTMILEKKSNNARTTINTKGEQLQKAANSFQDKINNNGFTSEAEAQRSYNAIQKGNQDLQDLQARLNSELQAEADTYNAALRDSLQSFLADYNKDKQYDLILAKAGDNILYAAKALDITGDVIKGLNKRYKPIAK